MSLEMLRGETVYDMNDHMARWSTQPQDDHQHALYEEESFLLENYSPYEEELWLCMCLNSPMRIPYDRYSRYFDMETKNMTPPLYSTRPTNKRLFSGPPKKPW